MAADHTSGEAPDETGGQAPHEAAPAGATADSTDAPVTPADLLRQALVDDEDPRFPRWLPLPGIVLGVGWAAYQATAGDAGVLPTAGVSLAIAAGTTLAAWFGWQLEID